MPIPKNGDIVFIERWGGVIGEVVKFEKYTLKLEFPAEADQLMRFEVVQSFFPVKASDIEILDARQVLIRMTQLLKRRVSFLSNNMATDVKKLVDKFRI